MHSNAAVRLTEDQIALSLARQSKRKNATQEPVDPQMGEKGHILVRDWANTGVVGSHINKALKVMTWNLLAQCLVRRDLFPTSDCLKASQREGMLIKEILTYSPDIVCLQEVDRTEKLLPPLHDVSYKETYASGPGKRHGCMILYRDSIFEKSEQRTVSYDDLDVRSVGDERRRRGSSRKTKNIGLILGLRRRDRPGCGYVIATTHLFWHPSHTYERIRQAGLLLREISDFQKVHGFQQWTCIIAGDFNFTPTDAGYSLLVGDPLTSQQVQEIETSRVVHASIDPSIPTTVISSKDDEDGNGAEVDADRVITNARQANEEDGLLSDEDLQSLLGDRGTLRSVYDEGQRAVLSEHDNVIGKRLEIPPLRKGAFEPMWTSYTHYWKTTLDYIFILDPEGQRHEVSGFLKTHRTPALQLGLPLRGVCGSDHISLVGEIDIPILKLNTN